MGKLEIVRASQRYLSYLQAQGMDVEVHQDFETVKDAALETGRDYQLPTFAIERNDHTRGSVFWFFLREGDQRIAGVAAMQQDLRDEPVDQYLQRVSRHQYKNSTGVTIDRVAPSLPKEMRGRLAYIGELAVRPDRRGRRKMLENFMRLMQALVLLEWDVDWTYAFVPKRHVDTNLDLLYGFMRRMPNAQRWVPPVPEKRGSTEWWVGSKREDLIWLFATEGEFQDQT